MTLGSRTNFLVKVKVLVDIQQSIWNHCRKIKFWIDTLKDIWLCK